ncbi:hypothetical protein ACJX0J_018687 [Zea mays]
MDALDLNSCIINDNFFLVDLKIVSENCRTNPTTSRPGISTIEEKSVGRIDQIIGPVLDITFPTGKIEVKKGSVSIRGMSSICYYLQRIGEVRAVYNISNDDLNQACPLHLLAKKNIERDRDENDREMKEQPCSVFLTQRGGLFFSGEEPQTGMPDNVSLETEHRRICVVLNSLEKCWHVNKSLHLYLN